MGRFVKVIQDLDALYRMTDAPTVLLFVNRGRKPRDRRLAFEFYKLACGSVGPARPQFAFINLNAQSPGTAQLRGFVDSLFRRFDRLSPAASAILVRRDGRWCEAANIASAGELSMAVADNVEPAIASYIEIIAG